jgi:transcriptional regulator with XRE-family HTH domain
VQTLKNLRAERGLTLDDLAARAGISKAGLWKIENGKSVPNLRTLEKLARAFSVEVEDLVGKDHALLSKRDHVNSQGGRTMFRTSRAHVGRLSASSRATEVTVDRERLHTTLHAVELGLMDAETAEQKLLAGAGVG